MFEASFEVFTGLSSLGSPAFKSDSTSKFSMWKHFCTFVLSSHLRNKSLITALYLVSSGQQCISRDHEMCSIGLETTQLAVEQITCYARGGPQPTDIHAESWQSWEKIGVIIFRIWIRLGIIAFFRHQEKWNSIKKRDFFQRTSSGYLSRHHYHLSPATSSFYFLKKRLPG